MANRDLSNFREVTQIQPELEGQGLIMAGEIGSKIVDMSQKAKVAENLSAAQLELAKLDNDFRIKNEANPFDKKAIEAYKSQRKATLGNYRSDIGSLWASDFDTQADNLIGNSDLQMQNWGYKQAEVNTLMSLDAMGQNNKQLMMQHGLNYAKTGEGDLDVLLDFKASREQLMKFAQDSGAVGEVTAQKTLAAYDSEMAGAFLGVVAGENPYRAKNLLDSGKFDSSINVEDRLKLAKTIDKGIKAARKEAAANEVSLSILDGTRYADPANAADRKIINNLYKQSGVLEAFAQGDEQAAQETVGYIYETGIVPESVQQTLRGQMTSNDPQAQQYAYSVIGKIQEAKPTALIGPAGFSEKEIQNAAAYNGMVRAGANSQFALDAVKRSNDPFQQDIIKMRETEANSLLKEVSSDVVLEDDAFDGSWFSNPSFMNNAVEGEIMADYKTIFKQAYAKYGNEEAARATAIESIKTTAGVSKVTGKDTLMKYAPEKFYSVQGLSDEQNQQWLKRDLSSALKTKGIEDLSKVSLIPSYDTPSRTQKGLPPVYNILVEGENGVIDNLRDEKNMPVGFVFDIKKGLEKQKAVRERVKAQEQIEEDMMENYEYRPEFMSNRPVKVYKGGGEVIFPQMIYDTVKRKIKETEADRLLLTPEEQEEEKKATEEIMKVL